MWPVTCGMDTVVQAAKASPLNSDEARAGVKAQLARVLDKEFIREHAKSVRWTPHSKL